MAKLKVILAQIDPIVGDVAGNVRQILHAVKAARQQNAQLILFPELALTGYPPEDLLLRPGLLKRVDKALLLLKKHIHDVTAVVGHPAGVPGQELYNAASVITDGEISHCYFKQYLPNYGVFDEKRYFEAGTQPVVFDVAGIRVGLTICEDIWFTAPAAQAADNGAELLVNINASPFHQDKTRLREEAVSNRARENSLPVIYLNQVGGQDELVFDGNSFAVDAYGEKVVQAPAFSGGLFPVKVQKHNGVIHLDGLKLPMLNTEREIYEALKTGLRDYVNKNHFPGVVIGLSGGIDSALTLALAVDALGADRVDTVMMPSRYTAEISLQDAEDMAGRLGVDYQVMNIEPAFEAFLATLADRFEGLPMDTTEENIQARCRGVLLMALSNKTGAMVLATGNKSEMAVGYSTLYGDMAGGFTPLKDVYKTMVYRLSEYRNQLSEVIPPRIISRPPSAELAADQLDEDSLPAYPVLDQILEAYIVNDAGFEDMVAEGHDPEVLARVIKLIDRNEYKRRQAPPGIRISRRAFGRDRRYPITSGYTVTATIE